MALRGAVATACNVGGRQRNISLLSVPHYLRFKFNRLPSHPLHRFTAFPMQQHALRCPIRVLSEATANPTANPVTPKKEGGEESPPSWKIKMLYDGDCPLCMREVNMLRERNERYGTIKFVDISSDDYSPEENQGLDYKTVMGRIHAILSDGTVVTDVDAFRRLYEQVGLGWVYAITKYEPIATVADAIYAAWAKYRLQITGRPSLEEILEAQKKNKGEVCNDRNTCKT